MKITCSSCGHENDLGRVFCVECGARLDFSNTAVHQINDRQRESSRIRPSRIVIPAIVVLVLALAILAGWSTPPIGAPAAEGGSQRVEQSLAALRSGLVSANTLGASFSEPEINKWLEVRCRRLKLPAASIDLSAGRVMIHLVLSAGPYRIGSVTVGPFPYTVRISATPDAGRLRPRGVTVGHLPCPGPAGAAVRRLAAPTLEALAAEARLPDRISEIRVAEDQVEIVGTR